MKTYEETHPWLTFGLDIGKFDYRLWMALAEASSKCEHIAGVPLAPEAAQRIHQLYLAKGAAATTAIEGNSLSEEEVEKIIEGSLKLPPSQQYLADEVENIVDAVNMITRRIYSDGKAPINVDFLKELNRLVLRGLEVPEEVVPGEIRKHKVVVGRYRCAPPEDCEYLLERLCDVLENFPSTKDAKAQYSIVKAVFAHLYFVWIHPFGDGNGRTARLLELYILLCAGFPQPTGHLLSNHYNRTRPKYYEMLSAAVRSQDDVIGFIRYSVTGLVEGLREQIRFIRQQQWHVAWINYVHDQFHDKNSSADVRRRHLVLALSEQPEPVAIGKVTDLTPLLAREYAGKTPKTVVRDLNAVITMGLVQRRRGTVRALREKILAFLPWRNQEEEEASDLQAA